MKSYVRKYQDTDDGKFGYKKGNEFVECGNSVKIHSYSRNLDTGQVKLNTSFYVGKDPVVAPIVMDSNFVKSLRDNGYLSNDSHKDEFNYYIDEQLCLLEYELVYSTVGWINSDIGLVFRASTSIGAEAASRYDGILDIGIKCKSVKDYRNNFNALISGNIPLEFACVMGVSGCLVGYLNAIGAEHIDTLLYDVFGGTSTGKTTSIKLAVSMCGKPFTSNSKESLFGSCLTTKNAITARLNGNNGFFVAFDELEMIGKADITDIVYSIPNGVDKSRCDVTGDIKATRNWNTAVAFTGEHSVFESTTQKDGLQLRTISLGNISWTKDGQQARKVSKFARTNYGVVLPVVAKYLSKQNSSLICQEYESEVDRIIGLFPNDKLADRKATKLAVIVMTARYIQKSLNVNINEKAIEAFALKHSFSHFESEDVRAYDDVLRKFHENAKYFFDCTVTSNATTSRNIAYETYIGSYDEYQITILSSTLVKWFSECGYTNYKSILSKWKANGKLNAPKDRQYKVLSICINRKPERVYVIQRIEYMSDDSWKDQFEREYLHYYTKCRERELKKWAKPFKDAFDKGELTQELLNDIIDDAEHNTFNFSEYFTRWKYISHPELIDSEKKCKAKQLDELLESTLDD